MDAEARKQLQALADTVQEGARKFEALKRARENENLDQYKVCVPEGRSGRWCVEHVTIDEYDGWIEEIRAVCNPQREMRYVPPGKYTRLTRGEVIVMSDTPDEIRDHLEVIERAKGRVLIFGLGLGMVARACLEKPEVEHVTIVDRSRDVIKLVAPSLAHYGKRVRIVRADALKWQPPKGARWNIAWFDIWDFISARNLIDMQLLHRRFAKCSDWQGSWAEAMCRKQLEERHGLRQVG